MRLATASLSFGEQGAAALCTDGWQELPLAHVGELLDTRTGETPAETWPLIDFPAFATLTNTIRNTPLSTLSEERAHND